MGSPVPLIKISPSQTKTWRDCKRKWGYVYLCGLRHPGGTKAAFGSGVHHVLETYTKTGAWPTQDTLAKQVADVFRPHIPEHGEVGVIAEPAAKLTDIVGGVQLGGFIDLVIPAGIPYAGDIAREDKYLNLPKVTDYKTTGNKRYALKNDNFFLDPQVVTYYEDTRRRMNTDTVVCRWLYVEYKDTGGVFDYVSNIHIVDGGEPATRANTSRGLDLLCESLEEIRDSRLTLDHGTTPLDKFNNANLLDRNLSACKKYGGCKHYDYCRASSKQRADASFIEAFSLLSLSRPTKKDKKEELPMSKLADMLAAAKKIPAPGGEPIPKQILSTPERPSVAQDEPETKKKDATKPAKKKSATKKPAKKKDATKKVPPKKDTSGLVADARPDGHGLTLYIGCVPTKGAERYVSVRELFSEFLEVSGDPLVPKSAGGKTEFWTDQRNRVMRSAAMFLKDTAPTGHVFADRMSTFDGFFLDALKAYASSIIERVG